MQTRKAFGIFKGTMDAATIEKEALTLTVTERALLANRLLAKRMETN
ncbi:MAG: hypothetical protein ACK5LK_11230 [Chthoniobacterales bacterium]